MNFRRGAASLVALALFSVSVLAQSSDSGSAPVENADNVKLPDDILALVNDKRTAQELSDDELKVRARAASRALKDDSLAPELRDQLQALMESDQAEFKLRKNPKRKEAAPKVEDQPVQEAAPEPKIEPKQPRVKPSQPNVKPDPPQRQSEASQTRPQATQD